MTNYDCNFLWEKVEELRIEIYAQHKKITELEANRIALTERNVELVKEKEQILQELNSAYEYGLCNQNSCLERR